LLVTKLPEFIGATHPAADWVKLLDLQNGFAIMQHLTQRRGVDAG
jgi:hypothetical protein